MSANPVKDRDAAGFRNVSSHFTSNKQEEINKKQNHVKKNAQRLNGTSKCIKVLLAMKPVVVS